MKNTDDEQKARDAYLGKNIRKVEPSSSLLQSTSAWLNNGKIREVIAVWLLRKNGPDFPVEADHTLGLAAAFGEVLPDAEVLALFEAEMAGDPELNAWVKRAHVSTYQNEDFLRYPAGTVGGMIGHQIREHGFDLTLGVGNRPTAGLNPLQYFRLRTGQAHDFEHVLAAVEAAHGQVVVRQREAVLRARHHRRPVQLDWRDRRHLWALRQPVAPFLAKARLSAQRLYDVRRAADGDAVLAALPGDLGHGAAMPGARHPGRPGFTAILVFQMGRRVRDDAG